MNRETINSSIFDGLDSINSVGYNDDFEEEKPKKEIIVSENENIPQVNKEPRIETQNIDNQNQMQEEKKLEEQMIKNEKQIEEKKEILEKPKENKEKEIKKDITKEKEKEKEKEEDNDDDIDEDDDDDDENVVERKLKKITKKIMYSFKDDINFMLLPSDRMPSNILLYFILFTVLSSISVISDIFSMIISLYKGQIFFGIIALLFRLIFILSNIITFKFEFQAIIIFQLIINNCLFFYSVSFIIFLFDNHKTNFSEGFIFFCNIFYLISILCNLVNIIFLFIKYYNVYASMTSDEIKYLKIFNKRTDSTEIQLVEKHE